MSKSRDLSQIAGKVRRHHVACDSADYTGNVTAASFTGDGSTLSGIESYDSAKVTGQFDSALPVALASDVSLGNITTTGYIRGPATFTIDPAAHGDSSGTLRILGGLTVEGTTTTINSTTVTTEEKNILIALGAVDSAATDGSGITVDFDSASMTYVSNAADAGAPGRWNFNRPLEIKHNTINETYGPTSGGSSGIAITDLATDSDSIISIKFASSDIGNTPRHFAAIAGQKTGQWAAGGGNYPGSLTFWTRSSGGNTTERMRITQDGNVGLGTDAPATILETNVASGNNEIRQSVAGVASGQLISSTTNQYLVNLGSGVQSFWTGGAERLQITAAGTVDIGGRVECNQVYAADTIIAGNGGGSVAMTLNDGYGNANLTFNHNHGIPDQTGNSLRIETNVDGTTGAYMAFEGKSGTTSGSAVTLNDMARMYADTGDFHANGNVVAYSTTISDERLKENVKTVTGALDILDQIRGVTFDRIDTGKKSAGVIAQELEKVMPYAIYETALPLKTGSEEDTYKVVEYDALHAVLIEAIKELKSEIDELKKPTKE